jgi:hypothetical protein
MLSLPRPPYSPDLASALKMKPQLKSRRFYTFAEIKRESQSPDVNTAMSLGTLPYQDLRSL